MSTKQLLKKVAKEFNLKFIPKNKFKVLILTKREIIICNFLAGSPNPLYIKYGNKEKKKIGLSLTKFLQTEDYKKHINSPQACIISQESLKKQLKFIPKISDKKINIETEKLYDKIKKKIGRAERLTLIWKPSEKEKKSQQRKEIILHEFVHELMEDNKIRPKSWKWNEGLVTYIANFAFDKHKKGISSTFGAKQDVEYLCAIYS